MFTLTFWVTDGSWEITVVVLSAVSSEGSWNLCDLVVIVVVGWFLISLYDPDSSKSGVLL